jgi:hypothetical protein
MVYGKDYFCLTETTFRITMTIRIPWVLFQLRHSPQNILPIRSVAQLALVVVLNLLGSDNLLPIIGILFVVTWHYPNLQNKKSFPLALAKANSSSDSLKNDELT